MKSKRGQKGFTLVELLIVIVILGILAALVVPRMLAQANQANTAEAANMLGTIRRSTINFGDATGAAFPAFSTSASMAAGSGWAQIGLGALPATRKFDYATPGGAQGANVTVTATRRGAGADAGNTMTINLDTGALGCGGYTPITDANGAVVRCQA